jgi:hypothetical protein
MRKNGWFVLALVLTLGMGLTSTLQGASFVTGDVFAGVDNGGNVNIYTPTGTLVTTLNTTTGTFTTGMAFDSAGNLYVTDFNNNVSKFDNNGTLINAAFLTGGTQATKESIVATSTGFFVGGPTGGHIDQFNTAGGLVKSYAVAGGSGSGGADWIDFRDPNTIVYTGEGTQILSFNIATNTQNTNIINGLPGTKAFALKVIPTGSTDAGDILLADSDRDLLIDPTTGTIVRTYLLGAVGNGGGLFALNIDPNGTSFWTGDFASGNVWELDIATGAVQHQFGTVGAGSLYGLAVFGERTTSGVPEPGSIILLCTVAGLVSLKLRKKLA